MSEKLKKSESEHHQNETFQNHEAEQPRAEKIGETPKETLDVEKTRELIDEIQKPSAHLGHVDRPEPGPIMPNLASAAEVLNKSLGVIRHRLRPSEKRFSKIIHSPIINNVSEIAANTLARPYAILSGGIVAVIGSIYYMYYTHHLGYKYNYFVPILLFAIGLIIGIIVELLYKFTLRRRKSRG